MTEPSTTADQVRLLTGLTSDELADGAIVTLLELNSNVVKLAAADALESFASTLLSVQSDDISVDGSKRATVLMARASRLREQAQDEVDDAGFTFDVVGGVTCWPELTERPCW